VSCAALVATLAGCASGAPASPAPSGAAPSGAAPAATTASAPAPAGWDQIVAEAKKEGEVIIWTASGSGIRQHEKDAFEKAYPGIKVTLFQAPGGSERDSRYIQEHQAGVAKLDMMITGSGGANARLKPAGLLQDLRPLLILPEVTEGSNWREGKLTWVDREEQYILQSDMRITPNLLANESVNLAEVQNWEDLLDPKWRGKIVMTDPRKAGDGFALSLFLYYAPELGPEYVQRLFGEQEITFSQDQRQNAEWVASGRMLLNLRPDNREVTQLLELGTKLQVVPTLKAKGKQVDSSGGSDGILFLPNLDPLPHPNATKLYVNWFYSRAGQQAMVETVERASRRVDVDHSKLPEYARPKPGVEYMNLNHYTEPEQVQTMRDAVTRAVGQ
jgi:ABC-type Fe3+ transport system substrate-binding protein